MDLPTAAIPETPADTTLRGVKLPGPGTPLGLTKLSSTGGVEMLWLLVLLLLLFAIGGGVFISKFLFVILVVALIVALLGARSTT